MNEKNGMSITNNIEKTINIDKEKIHAWKKIIGNN